MNRQEVEELSRQFAVEALRKHLRQCPFAARPGVEARIRLIREGQFDNAPEVVAAAIALTAANKAWSQVVAETVGGEK